MTLELGFAWPKLWCSGILTRPLSFFERNFRDFNWLHAANLLDDFRPDLCDMTANYSQVLENLVQRSSLVGYGYKSDRIQRQR